MPQIESHSRTWIIMISGLIGGIIFNLPYISWMNGYGWQWAYRFPIGWGGAGMTAMSTFFHELGHTLFGWFYGYVTLPTFDFTYGGGMAWAVTGQLIPLLLCLYVLIGYGMYVLREHRFYQAILAAILLFNLATAFTDYHRVVIDFMGPAAEIAMGGFFLYRAFLNLAPRGGGERFMNALIGSGMMIKVFITAWGLLENDSMREEYYNQKGQHGFGDFNKVSDTMNMDFNSVVWLWAALAILGVLIPFYCFCTRSEREI